MNKNDFHKFIQYNINDIMRVQEAERICREHARHELLPRFGSAWENMMLYYGRQYK